MTATEKANAVEEQMIKDHAIAVKKEKELAFQK